MDQEIIAYLDGRFRETARQIEGFRKETSRRFEQIDWRLKRLEVEIRMTQGGVERIGADVRVVATEVHESHRNLRDGLFRYFCWLQKLIHLSYSDLHRRMRPIEAWKERYGRDPIELLREKYGKKEQTGQDPVALVREKFGKKPDPST